MTKVQAKSGSLGNEDYFGYVSDPKSSMNRPSLTFQFSDTKIKKVNIIRGSPTFKP